MIDLQCPKCGSGDTKRMKSEVFDKGVKELWFTIVILTVLGVSINPVILFFAVAVIILMIIVNIIQKHRHRNDWIMQCARCGHQFCVTDPDKVESINAKKEQKTEERNQKAKIYAERNKRIIENLNRNGRLADDETLLYTVDYFCPHKSAYTVSSQLKLTDRFFICYNAKNSLRFPRNAIISIKKKNYFLIIPTGIQICVYEGARKRKYDFVVLADKRKEILGMLNNWKQV